jgi:hypothetical protein
MKIDYGENCKDFKQHPQMQNERACYCCLHLLDEDNCNVEKWHCEIAGKDTKRRAFWEAHHKSQVKLVEV